MIAGDRIPESDHLQDLREKFEYRVASTNMGRGIVPLYANVVGGHLSQIKNQQINNLDKALSISYHHRLEHQGNPKQNKKIERACRIESLISEVTHKAILFFKWPYKISHPL